MKRGLLKAILISLIIIFIVLLYFYLSNNNVLLAPSGQSDVRVGVGNAAPQITNVDTIPAVTLFPAPDTTFISFTFTARDPNGASDLDDTTATASFTKAGEATRSDPNCAFLSEAGKSRTYQCDIGMSHFDAQGAWDLTVSIQDLQAVLVNDASTFTVNLLRDITLTPAQIDFPTVVPEDTDVLPTGGQTTTVRNRGNYEGTISITSSDLVGETNPAEILPASIFRASGSSGAPTVCSTGTPLVDSSTEIITTTSLPRGLDDGSSNIEDISYCLTLVPDVSPQFYSATGGNAWIILI